MNEKNPARQIRPEDAAKGAAGEIRFKQWLEASEITFLNIEQTEFQMPAHLSGKFKQADYIAGIPPIGQMAFEVKVKAIYPEGLIFDLREIKGLRVYARQMCLPVFFVCIDPGDNKRAYWVSLDQLAFIPAVTRAGKLTVICPLDRAMKVDMSFSFRDALQDAIEHAIDQT